MSRHDERAHGLACARGGRTSRVDDVCCDVLWGDLWRDGHLWYDMLNLHRMVSPDAYCPRLVVHTCATKDSLMSEVMIVLFPTTSVLLLGVNTSSTSQLFEQRLAVANQENANISPHGLLECRARLCAWLLVLSNVGRRRSCAEKRHVHAPESALTSTRHPCSATTDMYGSESSDL